MIYSKQQLKWLERENSRWPLVLRMVPKEIWPKNMLLKMTKIPKEVWRSQTYLVQVYDEENHIERLSIQRTTFIGDRSVDGIAWDDLQLLKRECGRGDKWATEIYPDDGNIVNVANMRHLWILPVAPNYAWHK